MAPRTGKPMMAHPNHYRIMKAMGEIAQPQGRPTGGVLLVTTITDGPKAMLGRSVHIKLDLDMIERLAQVAAIAIVTE